MIGSRMTHSTTTRNAVAYMQNAYSRSSRAAEQLSSGKRIQRPSDDPSGAVASMSLRSDARAKAQYVRNGDDGIGWLSASDSALQGVLGQLQQVQQAVIHGANTGAMNSDSRAALAAGVRAARDSLLSLANTTYLDRPVFGGSTVGTLAFEPDPVSGTAGATFVGDGGQINRRLGDSTQIRVDTPGEAVFTRGGQTLFAALEEIATHLESDPAALTNDLATVKGFHTQIAGQLADVGVRYQRTESLRQTASDAGLTLRSSISSIEDIDVPAAIMEMELANMGYQAALGATAKVIQPTLLDFLR